MSCCDYFEWYDEEIYLREKVAINQLREKVDVMEEKVVCFCRKQRMYQLIILLSWLVVSALLLKN